MPPKERAVYLVLVSVFLFGAGYVGAQRLRPAPKIEINIPQNGKGAFPALPNASMERSIRETSTGSELVVDVVGEVKSPGLIHLPAGSRIDDAVKAAGGAAGAADLEGINLAAKLEDGQQVRVPKKGEGAEASSETPKPSNAHSAKGGNHPDHPINLSSSSYAQLEELPGVGPSMAEKLMAYRLEHGHLTFEDLRSIPGLGPKRLEKIKPWVRG